MDDLISRQQAIDELNAKYHGMISDESMKIYQIINWLDNLPPTEPKRGKWNRLDMDTFNCNKCGATFVLNQGSEKMHFCPNCGAKIEVTT